jgi:pre-mRNA-splicing factor CWC26
MADRKAYLAEKYMSGIKAETILSRTAPQKKKKKRKTNQTTTTGGAIVVDEDGGWGDEGKEDADDLEEAVVEKDRAFKKRRTAAPEEGGSGWAVVREGHGPTKEEEEEESLPLDEQPLIVGDSFVGGLITSKQLQTVLPKSKVTEITPDELAAAQETIYRDAAGQKIDTKAEKAAAARRKRELEELEARKMEWGKGLVQREERERERQELEKLKGKDFTRYADDADLNEELKSKMLWNDPAAAFLTVGFLTFVRFVVFNLTIYSAEKNVE